VISFAGRLVLFIAAAGLGGAGGALRFAVSDVPWPTFGEFAGGVVGLAAVGTGLRIALQDFAVWRHRHLRYGMFAANVIGTAALAFALDHSNSAFFSWAFMIGFCGGLTTFSGFVNESLALVQHHRRVRALVFVVATLGLSFEAFRFLHASSPAGFPWRTMVVNLTGCFAFGVIDKAVDPFAARSALHRLCLSGFLGGYTTLSALVAETLALAVEEPAVAVVNVAFQVVMGVVLIIVGRVVGVRVVRRVRRRSANTGAG